jgi:hypothetical protein
MRNRAAFGSFAHRTEIAFPLAGSTTWGLTADRKEAQEDAEVSRATGRGSRTTR